MPEAMPSCRRRERCALCGTRDLATVLELPPSPLGNVLRRGADAVPPSFPIGLGRCTVCGHVQLLAIVERRFVLGQPAAADGGSPQRTGLAETFARTLLHRLNPGREQLVVDIGSNDGTFLKVFDDAGLRVQGIEPAVNLAAEAVRTGVPTHCGLFSPAIADRIEEVRGLAAIVVAHQALAEAEDPFAVLDGVRTLLRRDGVFAFSVDSLAAIVAGDRIARVDHRSLGYHTVAPLRRFLAQADLELIAIARRGVRLEGLAQRPGGRHHVEASVDRLAAEEAAAGCADGSALTAFAARSRSLIAATVAALTAARKSGARIAALGAGCGIATMLVQLGDAASAIAFLADPEPERQGLLYPVADLPIRPLDDLDAECPDLLLVLDDDAAQDCRDKLAALSGAGTRILMPAELLPLGAA